MSLQSNAFSHWLGAKLESALYIVPTFCWTYCSVSQCFRCCMYAISHMDVVMHVTPNWRLRLWTHITDIYHISWLIYNIIVGLQQPTSVTNFYELRLGVMLSIKYLTNAKRKCVFNKRQILPDVVWTIHCNCSQVSTDFYPYSSGFLQWLGTGAMMWLCKCEPSNPVGYGWINSSPPSAAYMHQWTASSLVQVMACRLLGKIRFLYNAENFIF